MSNLLYEKYQDKDMVIIKDNVLQAVGFIDFDASIRISDAEGNVLLSFSIDDIRLEQVKEGLKVTFIKGYDIGKSIVLD